MARGSSLRGLAIERRQVAGLGIEGERRDAALAVAFAHRVQETAVRMQGQEGRVDGRAGDDRFGQLAGGEVHVQTINALALGARVGADIDPGLAGLGFRAHDRQNRRQAQDHNIRGHKTRFQNKHG